MATFYSAKPPQTGTTPKPASNSGNTAGSGNNRRIPVVRTKPPADNAASDSGQKKTLHTTSISKSKESDPANNAKSPITFGSKVSFSSALMASNSSSGSSNNSSSSNSSSDKNQYRKCKESDEKSGSSNLQFGTLGSKLPPRTQSAPPQILDERSQQQRHTPPTQKASSTAANANSAGGNRDIDSSNPSAATNKPAHYSSGSRAPSTADYTAAPASNPYYYNNGGNPYYSSHLMMMPNAPPYIPAFTPPSTASSSNTGVTRPLAAPPLPRKKLAIINPHTGKEVDLGGIAVNSYDNAGKGEPAATTASVPAIAVSAPATTLKNAVGSAPRKGLEIVDPSTVKPKVEIQIEQEEDDDDDLFEDGISNDDDSASCSNDDDDDDSPSDYNSIEDDEDDLVIELPADTKFPVILTRGIRVEYPSGCIPWSFPPKHSGSADADAPLVYSPRFMLQFEHHCMGAAEDIASATFAKFREGTCVNAASAGSSHSKGSSGGHHRDSAHSGGPRRRMHTSKHAARSSQSTHAHAKRATLKNRAANAWKKSSLAAKDTEKATIATVKGILNKLSTLNFDRLQAQILALDILRPAVMTGVIDLLFEKAVEEPKFACLYALLCERIVRFETAESLRILSNSSSSKDEEGAAPPTPSQFRKYLISKCQLEYESKKAYSQKRLERLLLARQQSELQADSADTASNTTQSSLAAQDKDELLSLINNTSAPTLGEMSDDDYALVALKRRVLGNMRFIGELFMAGLISSKIMHGVTTELLKDVDDPEEEEVESLCKLLTTIGGKLDVAESANFMKGYCVRMKALSVHKALPSRVRFMVLDVLELREGGWKVKVEKPAGNKTTAPHRQSMPYRSGTGASASRKSGDRHYDSSRRSSSRSHSNAFDRSPSSSSASASHQDARNRRSDNKPPVVKVMTSKSSASNSPLNTSASMVASTSNTSLNKFELLNDDEAEDAPEVSETEADGVEAKEAILKATTRKLFTTLKETESQKNYNDLFDIIFVENGGALATDYTAALFLECMEAGGPRLVDHLITNILPLLIAKQVEKEAAGGGGEERLLDWKRMVCGVFGAKSPLQDLQIDIPRIIEYVVRIASCLSAHNLLNLTECFKPNDNNSHGLGSFTDDERLKKKAYLWIIKLAEDKQAASEQFPVCVGGDVSVEVMVEKLGLQAFVSKE